MEEILAHPAVQAAVAPFVVAMSIALLFRRFGLITMGLAIIAGVFTTVMLTTGLSLQSLDSNQKIILSSLCLPFVVLLMEVVRVRLPVTNEYLKKVMAIAVPAILLVLVANWVIWPVFLRQETVDAWLMSGTVSLYVGVVGALLLTMAKSKGAEKSPAQGAGMLVLGVGTSITCMIAASAFYAQLAASVSASVGALLLIGLFSKSSVGNNVGYLGPFGLFAAATPLLLIGAAATVYAQPSLSGWVLLCLASIPLIAGLRVINIQRSWLRLICTCLLALLPLIPAIWLAWVPVEPSGY